jgi:hypothetical protein
VSAFQASSSGEATVTVIDDVLAQFSADVHRLEVLLELPPASRHGATGARKKAKLIHPCCTWCGDEFDARRAHARFCSTRCQVATFRAVRALTGSTSKRSERVRGARMTRTPSQDVESA